MLFSFRIYRKISLIEQNSCWSPILTIQQPRWHRISSYFDLIAFAEEYHIIVLHDNAYSELVFDGKSCGSFLADRIPWRHGRRCGIQFPVKNVRTGRSSIGFCVGNATMVSMLKKLKSNMDYGTVHTGPKAAIAAITGDQSEVERVRAIYEQRRDILCDGFSNLGWPIAKPEATMFVWSRIPAHYDSSEQFAMDLVTHAGVIATPGSAFGPSGGKVTCASRLFRIMKYCNKRYNPSMTAGF